MQILPFTIRKTAIPMPIFSLLPDQSKQMALGVQRRKKSMPEMKMETASLSLTKRRENRNWANGMRNSGNGYRCRRMTGMTGTMWRNGGNHGRIFVTVICPWNSGLTTVATKGRGFPLNQPYMRDFVQGRWSKGAKCLTDASITVL